MENLFKKKFMRVPHMPIGHAFREIGRNAFVDWILILIVSFAIGGILVAGGIYLYWQTTSGKFEAADVSAPEAKVFDKNELSSLIDRYKAREDASLQIKKGYKGPADPSF